MVLIVLYALIALFSKVIRAQKAGSEQNTALEAAETATQAVSIAQGSAVQEISAGKLQLKKVDEKTAAMIMAIVSHESGIPLSELRFRSIKLIEENN
ncbi:MAG: OadG family transporter subunit [Caldicoprobacterales bacterium]